MSSITANKRKSTKRPEHEEVEVVLPTKILDYECPEPFTENFKWPGSNRTITFTATSFQEWIYECMPFTRDIKPLEVSEVKKNGITIGDKYFYMRPFPTWHMSSRWMFGSLRPTRHTLHIYQKETPAHAGFDDVVNIPILCDDCLTPWMSITPNEVLTQRGQIRRAKGNVGIAGLGMGWAAHKILQRKQVKHLTIYEIDSDVVSFFGDPLKEQFGDRVTIECVSAYDVNWSKHDVALWDIWMGLGEASYDEKFWRIKRAMEMTGKTCVGWGQTVHSDHC